MTQVDPGAWPVATVIETERLRLEPLRVDHAMELAAVLDDERLHQFIGGRPATEAELRSRYASLVAGWSPDGSQGWLNWVVRERGAGTGSVAGAGLGSAVGTGVGAGVGVAVGTVQATLWFEGKLAAEIAWVIATRYQGRGYAKEAAAAMIAWLGQQGVRAFIAHIHRDHAASSGVARYLGLRPTEVVEDGEVRWVR